MEWMTAASLFALSIVLTIIVNLLSNEIYAKLPGLSSVIIEAACRKLPPDLAWRREEWLAHLGETTGSIAKFFHACGCYTSVHVLRDIWEEEQTGEWETKSITYRIVTSLYMWMDCAVLAAGFTLGIALIPVMLIAFLIEVFFNIKLDMGKLDFAERYWDRRRGKPHEGKDNGDQ